MTEVEKHRLDVPGATLAYDIRRSDVNDAPILLMVGSPMGAAGFGTLASWFADRTVVTYDPRGVERSPRTDDATESTPDEHANDLFRVIDAVTAAPVDVFASSGGAVNALVLVSRHPERVGALVAHEPPVAGLLPDHEAALAACRAIHETYGRDGFGPAMAMFIALVSHKGPVPPDWADGPAPDPAMFGLPTEDDGSRNDALLGQNMVTSTHCVLDFDALRAASTRIAIGAGIGSEGELAHRAAVVVAERLGTTAVAFPSDHGGFLGGEYGQTGEPEAFAATLREVLAAP